MRIRVANHLQEGINNTCDVEIIVLRVLQSQACIFSQRQILTRLSVESGAVEESLVLAYSAIFALLFAASSIRSKLEVNLHVDW